MSLDIPLCRSIPLSNQLCFPLPGGGKVCSPMGLGSGDLSAIIQGQLGLMSSSMGALGPIFIILDVLQTLIECVTGIKDALGPPPDPSKLIKCIEKLVKLVAAIAGLLPQVWAPKAVKSTVKKAPAKRAPASGSDPAGMFSCVVVMNRVERSAPPKAHAVTLVTGSGMCSDNLPDASKRATAPPP